MKLSDLSDAHMHVAAAQNGRAMASIAAAVPADFTDDVTAFSEKCYC